MPGEADVPGPGSRSSTRERVLVAAAQVFSANGYGGATLLDISRIVGVRQGSLYYHFPSKEVLVVELLRAGVERTSAAVKNAVNALPARAGASTRLHRAIAEYLDQALARGSFSAAYVRIIGQVPAEVRNEVEPEAREFSRYMLGLFEDARSAGALRTDIDLPTVWLLVVGAVNWTVEWPGYRKQDIGMVHENLEKLVFGGIDRRV
ncbi:TetR/AcrR family transcriptional regulator [Amycolatopsis acidiphila]|uniref:TetR/AcrR family transcriptional regulator n=1 Tax=Amycolatopsis acidiphila TaxID=715473 RepID=A0A558AHV7_9PSEU|nr:TetR/AcrR family transcriptional regulator [Amycolatopsis acidiphila]TVT23854.1 TetR/AcrR family transcriptional regulator [Amycolatopsis acidiphila]UIJ61170.1 TetR/AcrR family transcriptional regulator [Amycolatopsis acidiphila]GHG86325.1 TetR family transcriptional regulator [Amycolatopsis acidiphila]